MIVILYLVRPNGIHVNRLLPLPHLPLRVARPKNYGLLSSLTLSRCVYAKLRLSRHISIHIRNVLTLTDYLPDFIGCSIVFQLATVVKPRVNSIDSDVVA